MLIIPVSTLFGIIICSRTKEKNIITEYYGPMPMATQTTVRISPSLMPCDAPWGLDNIAFGMTLSVVF